MDWQTLSGVILEGGYELKDVLEVRDVAARIRVRVLGGGGQTAVGYFLQLEPKAAKDQLDVWTTLREAPHPNLSRPLAAGRIDVSGVDAVYMVVAEADEKLIGVVPERPLEWEEAAEVLHSSEKALAHLHANGLVHGGLSPETIQAVGYTIQLAVDGVRRKGTKPVVEWEKPRYLAPESKGANTSVEADVWCLGASLFEVLAQEQYGTPGATLEQGLPLAAIVKRCLETDPATRCKLKDAASFEAEAAAEAPVAPAPVAAPLPPAAEPKNSAEPAPIEIKAQAAPTPPSPATPAEEKSTTARPPDAKPARSTPPSPSGRVQERPRAPLTPHPLTPKPSPPRTSSVRAVTKEDMALVPIAKRQKRVQGKRQPIDARIRVLEQGQAAAEAIAESGPRVAGRLLGIGKRSSFTRGLLAGGALLALLVGALWFIILPRLQTRLATNTNSVSAQTAPAATANTAEGATQIPPPVVAPATTVVAAPGSVVSAPTLADSAPSSRPAQLYRVVVTDFDVQTEARQRAEALSAKHPDLFFHVISSQRGMRDLKHLVVVGGPMTWNEANELQKRVTSNGLASRVEKITE